MNAGSTTSIVVMGVQGIGKSTIGKMLAERLGVRFVDGDELHSPQNVELMAAGTPLSDEDREPWLHAVGETLAAHADGVVVACSALRREYRDLIREHDPRVYFVEPWGPIELVRERVGSRTHEYMPASLLQSQYDTLEPLAADERGIRVSVTADPDAIVDAVLADYLPQKGQAE
ncbi:gluconokinase [Microbacterium murale]|uniref:Gluconokinase n=1 Tax=Microbacterium murale TaxID=1081040 RepID=A0ABU0P4G6_9MICO|nr:gluconokinase [Microbacterium murale]MDQ0642213.1 gluconokinase [Microbacterium murale]